jgi:hypothetical protein
MVTKNERLQHAWHRYEIENGYLPSGARDAAEWAVREGILDLPEIDAYDILARDMARALREEYETDTKGRRYRVNHAVRVTEDGVQYTFWAIMGFAPHDHMERAFAQRREQIIGDCLQLKTDVDVYNDLNLNSGKPLIQLILDFTEDVAERQLNLDDEERENNEDDDSL